ncbi:hypothetical protein L3X38_011654 [Prunus dulcis]|uniref:DNA glycosylase superfamily protein n=1 Tax=Prunus dulcis TaxID=3755 RepID=A0AAD4ZFW9_PRUDU|nr:hypothetical protein L3X38_011654 [Prunus dulcis]
MVSPIKLMIAEEEKFQGKALSLSHTKTAISTIKDKFSSQQLRGFEESCFGHLLLIEDLKWTSPIVHGLLLRKVDPKTVSQVNVIKFIVGNKVTQFTVQQFCVIAGLRFGNLPFIPVATNENCSLKRKYFCNDKTVNLLELEKAFLDCANEDDYLKSAEDLEEFVKYPWGAVSYAKTNASLLRALCADYQRVQVPKKAVKRKNSEKNANVTSRDRLHRSTILSALGPPLCPHGFVSKSSQETSQWATHPWIALAPNTLNFGVPMTPKPVSSQKASC